MKSLPALFNNIVISATHGNIDIPVSMLSLSSKNIKQNALFVAIVGNVVDGHIFIDDAISKGAKCIVYQNDLENIVDGITYVKVPDTKEALGILAGNFYDNPSEKMKLVGVTGTNGKTTITTLLHQLFRNLGHKTGMIGTVVNKINDESVEAERTTPDAIVLQELLAEMVEAGCEYCFMEVSSHAVSEKRISGIHFAGGVFTNLTLDHLDYHQTFENYRDAKKGFFDMLHASSFAISNKDDANGEYILQDSKAKKYLYSLKSPADFNEQLATKLIGEFNLYNTLAVYATAITLGQDSERVREEIKILEPVEGRFQYIKNENGVTGIVDYAHTPDALENVLRTINAMKGTSKVITVVGCGGDRDRSKRPIMARIGYDMSDILILTSDNPRTENPESILSEMQKGIEDLPQEKVFIISNRHEAIKKACELSQSFDYILIAGKGHEKYQEVNGVKNHFDDMEELKMYFIK